ncbi:MAG TPA: helix-turn-helix domain-containing protein [Anaerovoracaceae bacterium]|nr:helix-turn-helix domain-containing protein [Anaerovoracaceae bacterium]
MSKTNEFQKLFKVQDVADILELSISGVYNLIQRGGLPTLKIGKSYRIKPSELERWMNDATYMSDYDKAKLIAQEKIKIKRN